MPVLKWAEVLTQLEQHQIGSHISTRKGYYGAAKTAQQMGAHAFQYFPKNPRSLSIKAFDLLDAERCSAFCKTHGISSIAHTPYPTNLAVESPDLIQFTVQSLLNDLEIAEACGSVGIVVHFGTYKGKDPLQGYKNILQLLNSVLAEWEGNTLLLLENQSGDGGKLGTTLEEHVHIRSLSAFPHKIGFCLDTCHAFASGLWTEKNEAEWIARGETLGYWEHLKAIHLNDSVYPSGSLKDRHANVGKGYIGEHRFRQLLSLPYMRGIPIVLETGSVNGSHQAEIEQVYGLCEGE